MRRNSLAHILIHTFKVEDFVIIKKIYNNTNTRKGKFASFYSKKCVILKLNFKKALVVFEDGSTKRVHNIIKKS